MPIAASIDASRGKRDIKISVFGTREVGFGSHEIDLSALEQLVGVSQVRAVADALIYARENYVNGERCLREIVELLQRDFAVKGLDVLSRRFLGHYALPRKFEVAAALNRLRSLRIEFKDYKT